MRIRSRFAVAINQNLSLPQLVLGTRHVALDGRWKDGKIRAGKSMMER